MSHRFMPLCVVLLAAFAMSAQPPVVPSKSEVEALVRSEPMTLENWATWRKRLLDWLGDRTGATDSAYKASQAFMQQQSGGKAELPAPLAKDAFAWYLLGNSFRMQTKPASATAGLEDAEQAYRRCLELDPTFARAHRNIGYCCLVRSNAKAGNGKRAGGLDGQAGLNQAAVEFETAQRLDPKLPMNSSFGYLELSRNQPEKARIRFAAALEEEPRDVQAAHGLVQVILQTNKNAQSASREIQSLVARFPDDGLLAVYNGAVLAEAGELRSARAEWARARSLGVDPSTMFPEQVVTQIEAVPWWERVLWIMIYFAGFYAAVMALMALFGLILASRTRGERALSLINRDDPNFLSDGQIARHESETMLARLYGFALFVGLILFYVAIPFVLVGLAAATVGALLLIFSANRIPVKAVLLIVLVGGGMFWAVLTSIFRKPASGSFGLPKTSEECPRLYDTVADVARRVDTAPVDEIYIAPGAEIGVHQEGRGPFGIFGVKRRVLTLGLSTMRYLTVGQLQAILAHEYAHFSHKDTFYSRFIYQVHLSIGAALDGMGQAGGWVNYVNPFYWFMFLYYKCYSLLSAGFSRSREFLADRMASHLYGSDTFTKALTSVSTDGALFEATMYNAVADLLARQQAFDNMYEAFKSFRDEQVPAAEREEMYRKLTEEKGSLFASHPTYAERVDAVASLPPAQTTDNRPALQLFDNAEAIEKELTQFFTDYLAYLEHLRAQAMAADAANG